MLFLVILLYALFGFTFTLGKIVLFYASPFFVIATRMTIGGLALIAYLTWYHRIRCLPAKRDIWLYVQLIFFNYYFFYCARSWSLQYLTTTKAAILMNLSPFLTAVFAYFFLSEKLNFTKIIGLIIGFAGIIPVIVAHSPAEEDFWGNLAYFSLPEVVFIIAVASLSYSMIVMQKLVKHRRCNPVLVNALCMVSAGILAGSTSIFLSEKMVYGDPILFTVLIALQIIVSNILCSNLQAYLLRTYSTTFLAFASFISPLCAAIYGWLLLGEELKLATIASFIIVVIGLSIFYFDDLRKDATIAT